MPKASKASRTSASGPSNDEIPLASETVAEIQDHALRDLLPHARHDGQRSDVAGHDGATNRVRREG